MHSKIKNKESFVEKRLIKKAGLKKSELDKHKNQSLKISVFLGLFSLLFIGVLTKSIIFSVGVSSGLTALFFAFFVFAPLYKKRNHVKRVEAQLPLFLLRLASEIKLGKMLSKAIIDSSENNDAVSFEFKKVVDDLNKGASFQEALKSMNERLSSQTIRRTASCLSNIQLHGSKGVSGIKKLSEEMLIRQRVESKEFSGKMVVFALVFIAVSAIVPAMFQSFLLIGSYFMSIQFSPLESLIICTGVFPAVDVAMLLIIESKTPVFLK